MNASDYKKVFLAFLTTAYPDGLPLDFTELVLAVGDLEFIFPVDLDDYYKALGGQGGVGLFVPEAPPVSKPPKVTKKRGKKKPPKPFDQQLTDQDLDFLKGMKISLQDEQG